MSNNIYIYAILLHKCKVSAIRVKGKEIEDLGLNSR